MTVKHCSNHHMGDEKFFKKIKSMNLNHAKRANKVSKFHKLKQYKPLYPNDTPNIQPSINNRKDNADGNVCNDKQRR